MKPLSELVKDWRVEAKVMCSQAHSVDGSSGGLFMAAGELEAWLGEADEAVETAVVGRTEIMEWFLRDCDRDWIRHKLLGTTRQEEEK